MEKVLITGASGFLGSYIVDSLLQKGYHITTVGRQQATIPADLSAQVPLLQNPVDWVVHVAGKAHVVPKTEAEGAEFFKVNLNGTQNLCKAIDNTGKWPSVFIFISTVAVYGVDEGVLIKEEHPLDGKTPYALSKIEAEKFLTNWCAQHNVKLSILRLPLIAGVNPPGNLEAMIKGIQTGRYFNIGEGKAQKSVVMAADVAGFLPAIAAVGGVYNLTDGQHPDFASLALLMSKQLGKPEPKSIPGWLAGLLAFAGNFLGNKAPINSNKLRKITGTLTFDDSRARNTFGWNPSNVLESFIIK